MTTNESPSNPLDLSRVRSIQGGPVPWLCLTDVAETLGVPSGDPQLAQDFLAVPSEHRAVRSLFSALNGWEDLPVVTPEGLAYCLASSPLPGFRAEAVRLLLSSLTVLASSSGPGAPARTRGSTVWGVQPVRELLRVMNLSVSELVEMVNKVPGLEPGRYKVASVSAVLLGRQLPSQDFWARAAYVFQRPASELFTPGVVRAFERKHAVQPPSRPLPQSLGMGLGPADLSAQESTEAALLPRTPPPLGMVLLSPEELVSVEQSSPSPVDLDDEDDLPVIDPASFLGPDPVLDAELRDRKSVV